MIYKSITKNLEKLKKLNNSSDLIIRNLKIKNKEIAYVFLEGNASDDKISNYFMKNIDLLINSRKSFKNFFDELKNQIPNSNIKTVEKFNDIFYFLSCGFTIIFFNNVDKCIAIETRANLERSISEPSTELTFKGPKDSFNENHNMNIGLIRKRIKDSNLIMEELTIGEKTKTKTTICYLNDKADKNIVEKLKNRLKSELCEAIIDSGNVKKIIGESTKTNYPLIKSSERPDVICQALLLGKICIVVENSPYVLIFPTFFLDYFKTSEDYYQKPFNVNFTRILRIISFVLTLLTPAIYIALTTYNQEAIPDSLLLNLSIQREGIPFPTYLEILILTITFEVLRESDIRMPSLMGTSISIVGALVLGDAAVNAGIVSPFAIIIIAITSICDLIFSDIDFINATRFWRLLFIISASSLGLIGITSTLIVFITHLANASDLNIPFIYQIVPGNKKNIFLTEKEPKK